jgi:hypothetical protein
MKVSHERCKIARMHLEIHVCGYGRRRIYITRIRSTLNLEIPTYKTCFVAQIFDVPYL